MHSGNSVALSKHTFFALYYYIMSAKEVNYYRVLGVRRDATAEEIKKRYRTLSKQHHPDANGSDDGRMALINEAYAVLSNPLKRSDYLPPGTSGPIRHKQAYQTHPATSSNKKSSSSSQRTTKEDIQNENWSFLWWYLLAIPIALFLVTYGETVYKALFN